MTLDEIKKFAKDSLDVSQGELMTNKFIGPIVFGLKGSRFASHSIELKNKEALTDIPEMLSDFAKSYETIIIIFKGKLSETDDNEINDENNDESLFSEALMCMVFTKGITLIRSLRYTPGIFNFFDDGWVVFQKDTSGYFVSPFIEPEIVDIF